MAATRRPIVLAAMPRSASSTRKPAYRGRIGRHGLELVLLAPSVERRRVGPIGPHGGARLAGALIAAHPGHGLGRQAPRQASAGRLVGGKGSTHQLNYREG